MLAGRTERVLCWSVATIHAPGWRRDEMLVSLVCCIVALSSVSWLAAVGQWVPGGLGLVSKMRYGQNCKGGKCRSKPYGTPTRCYIETALSDFVILVLILLTE